MKLIFFFLIKQIVYRRKIWSLAQTATDSNSMNGLQAINQENTSPSNTVGEAGYLDAATTAEQQSQTASQQLTTSKGNSISPSTADALHISSYMNSQLTSPNLESPSMLTAASNNQLVTNYNSTLHQSYPSSIDLGHNSNTFLGKVFFDYISTGTSGPISEHERNWTTRIGLNF